MYSSSSSHLAVIPLFALSLLYAKYEFCQGGCHIINAVYLMGTFKKSSDKTIEVVMKSQYLKNFNLNITVLYRKNKLSPYNLKYSQTQNI